jgi:hypothetical protein
LRSSSLPSPLPLKSKTHTKIEAGLTNQMLIYTLAQFGLTPKCGDDADIKFHDRGASDHG